MMASGYPCRFRGSEIDRQRCPNCQGAVEVKIFSCSVHKLCSIAKPIYQSIPGRYQVCSSCPDRRDNPWVWHVYANRRHDNPWVWQFYANPQLD